MSSNAIRKYRLREVRKSRGKTGYEVAEYLNMSPQYYYELEREDKSIKGDTLIALADWYGVPVDELINNNMPTEEPGAKAFEDDWPEVVRVLRRSGKRDDAASNANRLAPYSSVRTTTGTKSITN